MGTYLQNYARTEDWQLGLGFVEERAAVLVRDPHDPSGKTTYFVLLDWVGARLLHIRDFRYARYVMEGAELRVLA